MKIKQNLEPHMSTQSHAVITIKLNKPTFNQRQAAIKMSKIKNTSTHPAVVILKKNSWCTFTLRAAATQKKRKIPVVKIRRCIFIQATVVTRKKKSILASQMTIQHTIIPTTTTRICTGFTCIF